jgi:hypothetical protein
LEYFSGIALLANILVLEIYGQQVGNEVTVLELEMMQQKFGVSGLVSVKLSTKLHRCKTG